MTTPRTVELVVNGETRAADAEPRMLLSDFLREGLGLTGTHVGCEHGVCGACTVLVNGESVRSCLMLAVQAAGTEIRTVEGLGSADDMHPLQAAFWEKHGLQCGFCTPGMLMTAVELLEATPEAKPGRDPRGDVEQSLPLHRLSDHRGGGAGRGRTDAGRGAMTRERHYIPKSRQREKPKSKYFAIGHSMKRVEDTRLLTGSGTYADDVSLPNMAHAAVLRSPHAHARIKSIDKSKAEALPGVLCVMTGAEAAEVTGPCADFSSPPTPQYCIAVDKVRHVGEAVAAVVAESRYIAEDACELIEVDYEPLPVVVDLEEAVTSSGDAVLHPERGDTNVALQRTIPFGTVDEDFAQADLVIERRLRWPRSGGTPIETVGATAHYDRGTGKFTIHANTSMYNYVGWLMAVSLKVDPHRLTIVPTDAGGSFGSKLFCHKVCTLAGTLARAAGRPVKYLEDRIDNMTSGDAHGSDRLYDAQLALKRDGTMLSMRLKVIDDYGAYFQYGVGQHGNAMAQVTGPYKINSVEVDLTAVFTNKCQQGAYRGFGSEVGNFVIERLVDAACEELGIDPIEMRRRNLIEKDQFPYIMPTGNMYDSGNYQAVLDEALGMIDYEGWRRKQVDARKLRGATSASASPPARSGASSAPPSSGCGTRMRPPASRCRARPRASPSTSTPPAGPSSR